MLVFVMLLVYVVVCFRLFVYFKTLFVGIAHRDLKPENILCESETVVIKAN